MNGFVLILIMAVAAGAVFAAFNEYRMRKEKRDQLLRELNDIFNRNSKENY